MLRIHSIHPGSPASRTGLKKTDILIACNGETLDDWFDFMYNANGTIITIKYKRGIQTRNMTIRRIPGIEWGFEFEGQSPRICRRKCIFCFIDQLPPGIRPSLLVKDDDIRYSFLQGTYVTLDRNDVSIAIKKNLSSVHVSVHASDPALRGRLLGTGKEEPIIPLLKTLSNAGISVETQIVIVPEWNNGMFLEQTLRDLFEIPSVTSVGVVPVGITSFRDGLQNIRRPTAAEAAEIIHQCDNWRRIAMRTRGTPWVYPADELFSLSGKDIPDSEYYEECTLRENGIGLLSNLLEYESRDFSGRGLICTGTLAAPFMKRVLAGSEYQILAVNNTFFGPEVGVSGLLAGNDIVQAVGAKNVSSDPVYLPRSMFNHNMLTLDDLSPGDIAQMTGREIIIACGVEDLI
ncbi:MAG: DUF512 domain-containing protein [Candidatus Aegiribacteria sp.]|nr:DUF512 domain-containing protein [Candidatus Aegiribacteria sp.]